MEKNITYALFGGSFDPPHLGHKEIIKKILEQQIANQVIVVPTYLNPFKKSFAAPPNLRLKWVKDSFNLKGVEVSDFEIKQERPVATIETLEHLSKDKNIKYIVVGSDNLKSITKWKNFEKLNNQITWIVASRRGFDIDTSMLNSAKILPIDIDVSSSEIRSGKKLEFLDKNIKDEVLKFYSIS